MDRDNSLKRTSLLLLLLLCATPISAQTGRSSISLNERPYSFYSRPPYRNAVPRPSSILGYEAGAWHSTFRDQERVINAIAQTAKDRVQVVDYGKSVEGRPLRLVLVSSPENMAKLEALRLQNLKIADPRQIASNAEREKILKSAPTVLWINHCIHGAETASFESFMWTLYTLAASDAPAVKQVLQNAIVILNPVFNPDGHERSVVYYNSLALGSPERWSLEHDSPWAIYGRFNHYRFDMNRDKLAQSQAEVRQEIAAYTRWFPQVYVDQHGQPETYFFPPNPEAIHQQVDVARLNKWTNIFGKANAETFDSYGWQHVTREDFDFFYPGYLDSWAGFSGAIGMTYETDGGGELTRRRRDETISTLRDATAHHVETALTTLFTSAKHHEELLRDFYAYRQQTIEAGQTGKVRRFVFPPSDPLRLKELAAILLRSGVEIQETTQPFESPKSHAYLPANALAEKHSFPKGSLIVDLAQPQGRLALAFLEADPVFNPAFVKQQGEKKARNEKRNEGERNEWYEFYDITAWSLPYAFQLEAYWLEDSPKVESRPLKLLHNSQVELATTHGGIAGGESQVAYLIPYTSESAILLGLKLSQEGYRLAVANKPFRADGKDWGRGTLILRTNRNPADLHKRLETLAKELQAEVFAIKSSYAEDAPVGLGSDSVSILRSPSIALVAGEGTSTTSVGAVWYLLEQTAGIKFSMLSLEQLKRVELSRFNVIILPDGGGYSGSLGKTGIDRLKEWIQKGGALIGLEGGGVWFTEKEATLSAASVLGEGAGKRPVELAGAIFSAQIDLNHFLGYGYSSETIAVPLMGNTFLKPTQKGSNVVTFKTGKIRLSGYVWEKNTEEMLGGTSYVLEEQHGRGHAILFLNDPTFRALWTGLRRMLWNSILFAPASSALTSSDLPNQ